MAGVAIVASQPPYLLIMSLAPLPPAPHRSLVVIVCIHSAALLQCTGMNMVSKMLSVQEHMDTATPFQAKLSPFLHI